MATITVSLPSDGDTVDVADYNTPITTIVNEFNGNLDATNFKTGGVGNSTLNTATGDIGGAWLAWTPTITSGTGTPTTVGATSAKYTQIGKTIILTLGITITTKGTATGALSFTLPITGKGIGAGGGVEIATTGQGLAIDSTTSSANVKYYNNATVWGDGAVLRIHLTYEMA